MIATWDDLHRELDRWHAAGRIATLWWRDDDATAATPALCRLLELAGPTPVCLAVIPAQAQDGLAEMLQDRPRVAVVQHGFDHVNRAAPGTKKCELAPGRSPDDVCRDLARGRARLAELFGARFRPVMVPPWNRIAPDLVGLLPGLGFAGLSTYNARAMPEPAPALRQANTHVDLVDWQAGGFVGVPRALGLLVGHLAARRDGRVDADEPTGLLTHHLVQDQATDTFLAALLAMTAGHAAVAWMDPHAVFGAP